MRRYSLALFALATCSPCFAGFTFALKAGTPGAIYSIDTGTAAAILVATFSGAVTSTDTFSDLAILNGVLYASTLSDGTNNFVGAIDTSTGVVTNVGFMPIGVRWSGLAADPVLNLLYAVNEPGSTLYTFDPSNGNFTTVGATGQSLHDLAYDPVHQVLFGVDDDHLYTIDTTTGSATLVGTDFGPSASPDFYALGYDALSNILFLQEGAGDFFSLDPSTGVASSVIGNNSAAATFWGMSNTIEPVPEPSTFVLIAIGLGATGALRRRQS